MRHHTRLFDHGIMIDYRSTDRSVEIIRRLAPTWEIRPTRNEQFHSLSIDAEVMDIEATIAGWKMCLNVTEFVLHDNLKQYVAEFERVHPGAREVVTTGFVIQDAPDQLDVPLSDADLWDQRHFGSHEPDPGMGWHAYRSRLLHKAPHRQYGPGRHNNGVSQIAHPSLFLFWYGWCPLAMKNGGTSAPSRWSRIRT